MNALLLNGSPREGNTRTALQTLKQSLAAIPDLQIDEIDAAQMSIAPCIACGSCQKEGFCVFDDDTNDVIDAVVDADILVFATPVYWWGMTAQLKLLIDKFYSRQTSLSAKKKQIGVIVIGQAAQEDPQYTIIPKQFDCISRYLGWEIVFCHTYTADAPDDLAKNTAAIAEITACAKTFRV